MFVLTGDVVALVVEPGQDVGPAVADVAADAVARWTLATVAPLVDGLHRHGQVVGQFGG